MYDKVIPWIFALIYVEAVTEILVDSEIFLKLRNWLAKKSDFINSLIGCGYCMSVWVSFSICWAVPGTIVGRMIPDNTYVFLADCFIKAMVLHRLSNLIHEGMKRWMDRYPWVISISRTVDNDSEVAIDIEEHDDRTT